jgi:hypothetical protein
MHPNGRPLEEEEEEEFSSTCLPSSYLLQHAFPSPTSCHSLHAIKCRLPTTTPPTIVDSTVVWISLNFYFGTVEIVDD